ncbi:MAG TPA: protein kinase [Pirellulaceae bacterium]|nr:protein kinase [Pirellulaceae bacterium]
MKFAYATGACPLPGYTIKRGIGFGGFGEVYFATTDAGKEVALKRVQRNLDVELRGVTACLNLKHTNLIALYDIKYDEQGQAWVIMEYVSGENLKEVIDRNPSGLPLEDVRAWMQGICAGVGYLHDHGIVHRDLKPGNLFSDEGIVKIGDYGLSKFISCSRRSGQTESVGTFHYMAPEIGRGSYGREIDIYALGIVLYEMLTGDVPFDGESSQEIIMKHLTTDPDVSSLPQPFASVIAQAMRKDPADRFHDVNEMLAALGWAAGSLAVPVTSPKTDLLEITSANADQREPMYIGTETSPPREIEFGEVRQQPPVIGGLKTSRHPGTTQPTAPRSTPQRAAPALAGAAVLPVEPTEPIAAALRGSAGNLSRWWRDSNLGTPVKVVLLIALGLMLVFNASWLFPALVAACIAYAIYYGIWSLGLAWQGTSEFTEPSTTMARGELRSTSFGSRRPRWQTAARDMLRRRSAAEKSAELSGSFLKAAFAAAIFTVLVMVISARRFDGSVSTYAFFAWFASVSTLGTWAILTLTKFLEGGTGEPVRRRFYLLIVGLALGAVAYGLGQLLMIDLRNEFDFPQVGVTESTSGIYNSQGLPMLPAYLAYFAGLFVALRWWRQADPLRNTRLSIWTTGMCVLWAALLSMFWQFPQPWGLMMAATISIATQLSAPWLSPVERGALRQASSGV